MSFKSLCSQWEKYFNVSILLTLFYFTNTCAIFWCPNKHLWVDGRSSLIALGAKVRLGSRSVIEGNHWNKVSSCFDPCQFPWCWLLVCGLCASWAETAGKQYYSACHPDMTDLPSCLYYQHQSLSGRILAHHHFFFEGGYSFSTCFGLEGELVLV